jgi:hypothetical protein
LIFEFGLKAGTGLPGEGIRSPSINREVVSEVCAKNIFAFFGMEYLPESRSRFRLHLMWRNIPLLCQLFLGRDSNSGQHSDPIYILRPGRDFSPEMAP